LQRFAGHAGAATLSITALSGPLHRDWIAKGDVVSLLLSKSFHALGLSVQASRNTRKI